MVVGCALGGPGVRPVIRRHAVARGRGTMTPFRSHGRGFPFPSDIKATVRRGAGVAEQGCLLSSCSR